MNRQYFLENGIRILVSLELPFFSSEQSIDIGAVAQHLVPSHPLVRISVRLIATTCGLLGNSGGTWFWRFFRISAPGRPVARAIRLLALMRILR